VARGHPVSQGPHHHRGSRRQQGTGPGETAFQGWYNTSRLMHRLGRRPPAEAEAAYWTAPAIVNTDRRQP